MIQNYSEKHFPPMPVLDVSLAKPEETKWAVTQYVKCVKNDTYFQDDLADSFIELKIGAVYSVGCWQVDQRLAA